MITTFTTHYILARLEVVKHAGIMIMTFEMTGCRSQHPSTCHHSWPSAEALYNTFDVA
jgi:hypothetical protein